MKRIATLGVVFLLVASMFSVLASGVQGSTGSFGHIALGTTTGMNGIPGVYVSAFQAPLEADNGVMTEIVCAIQTASGSGFIVPVVYAADGASNQYAARNPSTLLSTGSPVAISPTMEWKRMPLSTPVTIQGGKTYYFGYLSNVGTYPSQDYRNPPSTPTTIFEMELIGGWGSYPNPPAQFGGVTFIRAGLNILAVYAVYTTGGPSPPPDAGDVYSLTMYTVGEGTVTPGNTTGYHLNDIVNLRATPNSGWSFQTWMNATGGASTSVTIGGNTVVTATFIGPVPGSTGSFGHTALGTTMGWNGISGVYVSAFKAPTEANNGVITEIVCAVQTVSGSGFVMPVVYAADGKSNQYASRDPSTLLSTGSPIAIGPTMEWRHMPLSTPVTIQGNQTYYLGYLSNVGTYPSQDYKSPPSTPTSIFQMELAGGWASYPNPPPQFGKVTYVHAGANILAVYTVYTIGGL